MKSPPRRARPPPVKLSARTKACARARREFAPSDRAVADAPAWWPSIAASTRGCVPVFRRASFDLVTGLPAGEQTRLPTAACSFRATAGHIRRDSWILHCECQSSSGPGGFLVFQFSCLPPLVFDWLGFGFLWSLPAMFAQQSAFDGLHFYFVHLGADRTFAALLVFAAAGWAGGFHLK